jgi:hypothetical protein
MEKNDEKHSIGYDCDKQTNEDGLSRKKILLPILFYIFLFLGAVIVVEVESRSISR